MSDDEVKKPAPPNMAWMLTFGDLVSLLITFFVLLFSMKSVNQETWEAVRGSFDGAFSVNQPIMHITPDQDANIERVTTASADNLDYLQSILKVRFHQSPVLAATRMELDRVKNTLTLVLPTTLLFNPGSVKLKPEGRSALLDLAEVVQYIDNHLEVAGHTDPTPIRSAKFPSNWELAMLRANKVVEILEEFGVEKNIPAVSYGDSRFGDVAPKLPKSERYNLARRVEVIIFGKQ